MDKFKKINLACISIHDEMCVFEDELKKIINKDENFLTPDLNKFLFTNPKRLRPRFVFLFGKLLFQNFEKSILKISVITELIHNASLIHDDIIDEDDIRREDETFNKKFGSKLAVLEGDYLLALAMEELSKTNIEIMQIFSNRIKKTIQGEILQNENINKILDFETYINKTFNKTANLFLAGLEALFVVFEKKKQDLIINNTADYNSIKHNLIKFMENYSIAFQIKNDIENFKTNKTDFKNGNYTLPMIYLVKDESSKKANLELEKYYNCAIKYLKKIENKNIEPLIELCKITLRS